MSYDIGSELLVVLEQFLFDFYQSWFTFEIELILFLVLADLVEVVALELVFVVFVLFEGSGESFDFDLECFFLRGVHFKL